MQSDFRESPEREPNRADPNRIEHARQERKEEILRRQMDQELKTLRSEFAEIPSSQVTELGEAQFNRLRAHARITEFIPVLVHRYAREELLHIREERLRTAA